MKEHRVTDSPPPMTMLLYVNCSVHPHTDILYVLISYCTFRCALTLSHNLPRRRISSVPTVHAFLADVDHWLVLLGEQIDAGWKEFLALIHAYSDGYFRIRALSLDHLFFTLLLGSFSVERNGQYQCFSERLQCEADR